MCKTERSGKKIKQLKWPKYPKPKDQNIRWMKYKYPEQFTLYRRILAVISIRKESRTPRFQSEKVSAISRCDNPMTSFIKW